MKVLLVIQLQEASGLAEKINQYDEILSWFPSGYGVDCFVCSQADISKKELEEAFENTVYYFRPGVLDIRENLQGIAHRAIEDGYGGIICIEDGCSNELAVLLAQQLKWSYLTNVEEIQLEEQHLLCSKLVYNNNVKAKVVLPLEKFVISMAKQKGNQNRVPLRRALKVKVEKPEITASHIESSCLVCEKSRKNHSHVLIAVGRGMKSKADVCKIREYALKKGYMFGVTRPVAMNGWAGIDEIIGVSGSTYGPKICVTVGVSGSAAFYAGIEQSEYIVSINADKHAPIIAMSDVSVIDDYENIVEDLWKYI
ncbi:MAG: FAD-binding protein [Hespellia sp.]|nr:FAD-binding protein [Hespellia sp.]